MNNLKAGGRIAPLFLLARLALLAMALTAAAAPPDASSPSPPEETTASPSQPPTPQGADSPIPDKLKVYDKIDGTDRTSDLVGIADSATEGVTGQADLAKR